MKSIREVEEYIVHPNTLKNLRTGEVLIVCSKVDPHHGVVKTYLANEYRAGYVRANKTIRSSQVRRTLNTRITPRRNERESLSPKDFI